MGCGSPQTRLCVRTCLPRHPAHQALAILSALVVTGAPPTAHHLHRQLAQVVRQQCCCPRRPLGLRALPAAAARSPGMPEAAAARATQAASDPPQRHAGSQQLAAEMACWWFAQSRLPAAAQRPQTEPLAALDAHLAHAQAWQPPRMRWPVAEALRHCGRAGGRSPPLNGALPPAGACRLQVKLADMAEHS